MLKVALVLTLTALLSACGGAAAPAATQAPAAPTGAPAAAQPAAASGGVSQELIDAARKEGTVVWYTSVETSVAEEVAKKFESAYSGIKVEVDRTGSERVMQRVIVDDDWQRELRQGVRVWAAPFTWWHCAQNTLRTYRRVLGLPDTELPLAA